MRGLLLCFGVLFAAPTVAWASDHEERVAVVVGANLGTAQDDPLRYAESDAVRFLDVLIELGGVRPEHAVLVRGGGPERVLEALVEARALTAKLSEAGGRVVFLFYFSGH